jgi:ribosome-associated toxin RatA of RatAB toxin-antitoxin module
MKELNARAQTAVSASPEETLALLRAVEAYPEWYPEGVRSVSVLERDEAGAASVVRATLHLSHGPLQRDFALTLTVTTPRAGTIKLVRQSHGRGDAEEFAVTWQVRAAPAGSRIELALEANLSVPRFLPVGGVGESLANGFVEAAARTLRS